MHITFDVACPIKAYPMILIRTHNPDAIKRLLPDAGISLSDVSFNGPETADTKVIVSVGGQGHEYTHCYVQQHYSIPIISTYPPESIYRSEEIRFFILLALGKARNIDCGQQTPHKISDGTVIIPQTLQEATLALAQLASTTDAISVDIECIRETGELTCIGFANTEKAVVIPLQHENQSYWSQDDELLLWRRLASFIGSNKPKIFQNFIFDTMILSRLGIEVGGSIYDTMTLAHLIQPELPKGLADLARIYLYCEPWKGLSSWISNPALWQYNGRDAMYTACIHAAMIKLLKDDPKRLQLYNSHLVLLHREVLALCEQGLLVDHAALKTAADLYTTEVEKLRQSIANEANGLIPPKVQYVVRKGGVKPNIIYVKKGTHTYEPTEIPPGIKMLKKLPYEIYEKKVTDQEFNPASPQQVKQLITALGDKIPTNKGKDTTDELALKKLMAKTKRPIYRQLLQYREKSKLLNTYCAIQMDPDNKLRFTLTVPGTVTSRFSSKQTPWDTGCNVQNIPKNFRHIIVPQQQHLLLNVDLKQADPHVVAWLSGEQTMLDIMDSGGDLHIHTAEAICGHKVSKDSDERKLGKACNNALNYGMGAQRFAATVFKELGLPLTDAEAKRMIDTYFKLYPNIKKWHRSIEAEVYKTRRLDTPHGRVRHFYGPLNYKLVQDALAYIPPTVVSDTINIGWLRFIREAAGRIHGRVLQQCHDSLLLEVHEDDLDAAAELLLHCMEGVTFTINGHERHFDADIQFGANWGSLESYVKKG